MDSLRRRDLLGSSPFLLVPPALWSSPAQAVRLVLAVMPGGVTRIFFDALYYLVIPGPYAASSVRALATFLSGGEDGVGVSLAARVGVVVFGVLANHIRRVLCPGLGVGGYAGPVGMLKLARGSPELFLKEEFENGFPGRSWGLASGGATKVLGDWLGAFAGGMLWGCVSRLEDSRRPRRRNEEKMDERWIEKAERSERKMGCVAAVLVLVWALAGAEYVHARGAHVVALGVAYWKMAMQGEEHRLALWRIFVPSSSIPDDGGALDLAKTFLLGFWQENQNRLGVAWFHLEMLAWLRHGAYHLLKLAALSALGFGMSGHWERQFEWLGTPRPGLALVMAAWAWGTGYVVRHSNKYYIGLEMSDGLLVAWWACAAGVVGLWRGGRGWFRGEGRRRA